jgi:hypothetical protein
MEAGLDYYWFYYPLKVIVYLASLAAASYCGESLVAESSTY